MIQRIPVRSAERDAEVTSRIMAAVRRRDTRCEVALRKALFARGLRFRKDYARLPGRPDIVFPSERIAVFVDGDFWHGYGWKERGFACLEDQFKVRRDFWVKKIRRNMARDVEVNQQLRLLGWTVMRFLASRVDKALDEVVSAVAHEVAKSRAAKVEPLANATRCRP